MKVCHLNHTDLAGAAFNGYDLMNTIGNGFDLCQIVLWKISSHEKVYSIQPEEILHNHIKWLEYKNNLNHLLLPYAKGIINHKAYKNADIIHCHILHNDFISILDYPLLMNSKPCIWTVHDPWLVTGACVFPPPDSCFLWQKGCDNCPEIENIPFPVERDNSQFMWKLKERILKKVNPYIVVSTEWMRRHIIQSDITKHFDKIVTIPFGIDITKYDVSKKREAKKGLIRESDKINLGVRIESDKVKGSEYFFEALSMIKNKDKIIVSCIGNGEIPDSLYKEFNVKNFGWLYDESEKIDFLLAADIFVMPSKSESFGLMAIEAMAAGCCIISFKGTVLEDITSSPDIGVAVDYLSPKALAESIDRLADNIAEISKRGILGHEYVGKRFKFTDYVIAHEKLYAQVKEDYYRKSWTGDL